MSRSEAEMPPARPWPRSRLLNVWVDDLTMGELMQRPGAFARMLHTKKLIIAEL